MSRCGLLRLLVVTSTVAGLLAVSSCGKSDQKSGDTGDAPQGVFSGRVSDADSVVITQTAEDSTTVFDLLLKEHQVDYRPFGRSVFILAIDSVYQGNNHVWLFAVNDSMSGVGANHQPVGRGDRVSWFFRNIMK